MSQQTHLFKRNSTYYIRVKGPNDLQRHLASAKTKFSLKTKDHPEARRVARQASADFDQRCQRVRDELQVRQISKETVRGINDGLIQEVCVLWRHHALAGDEHGCQEGWVRDELNARNEER